MGARVSVTTAGARDPVGPIVGVSLPGDRFEPEESEGELHPAFRASAVHNALATFEDGHEATAPAVVAAVNRERR